MSWQKKKEKKQRVGTSGRRVGVARRLQAGEYFSKDLLDQKLNTIDQKVTTSLLLI